MRRLVKAVVDNTTLPVTVKTRLGWDRSSIVIDEVARMLEDIGVQALSIHCRTRDQGHEGIASWEYVEQVKKIVNIPVILNGDVRTVQDVKRAFETGADAVMIGRGAIANPWIFGDAKRYMATGELPAPLPLEERLRVAMEHLRMSIESKGDNYGILEFRKYWGGYLHSMPLASLARKDLVILNDLEGIAKRIDRYREEVDEFNRQRDEWQSERPELVGA
jgi:tRNA-dihydrouridine synthase B